MTPIIVIIIIVIASILAHFLRKKKEILGSTLILAIFAGVTVFAMTLPILFFGVETWSNGAWLLDKFSALMASLVAFIYIAATIVGVKYIGHEYEEKIISFPDFKLYFTLFHVFALCMIVTVLANNSLLLWMALEGTTLSSTFLVGLYRKKTSVEAAWKYIIICSTGINLGLLGILLLGYGASLGGLGGGDIFTLTSLAQNAHLISPELAMWSFVFLFVGFGAKLGLVPMHIWLADAHSNAPSPISALFSGILLNIALYGIIRFRFITDLTLGSSVWTSQMFLFFGFVSILIPALMMLAQKNYKRMLAYSSVEHMGIMTFALALSPLGAVAAVIHMIGHTLSKSMLFFGAGEILTGYGTTQTEKISGLMKKMPYTAILFLLGILSIIAMPPSALFVSEFTIFVSAIKLYPKMSLLVFVALSVIAYAMLRSTIGMFFGEETENAIEVKREKWNSTHWVMLIEMILIVSLTFVVSTKQGIEFIDSIARNTVYILK